MKKIKGVLGLLAGAGLLLSACEKSGGVMAPVNSADLIDKWYFRSQVAQMVMHDVYPPYIDTTTTQDSSATFPSPDTTYYADIRGDSTYIMNRPPLNFGLPKASAAAAYETGTWTLTGGNTLTLISSVPDTTIVTVGISGTTLTASYSNHYDWSQPPNYGTEDVSVTSTLSNLP